MFKQFIVITFVSFYAVGFSFAQTNVLWYSKFPKLPDKALSFHEWCDVIKKQSSKISQGNECLRFIGHPDSSYIVGQVPVMVTGGDEVTFIQAFRSIMSFWQIPFRIIDNIAVIGRKTTFYIPLPIKGRCTNIASGKPVTNFNVYGEDTVLPTTLLTIDTNGNFFCAIPFNIQCVNSDVGYFLDGDFYKAKQAIIINAPGYQDYKFTCGVWNWRDGWCDRIVDAKLCPKIENSEK